MHFEAIRGLLLLAALSGPPFPWCFLMPEAQDPVHATFCVAFEGTISSHLGWTRLPLPSGTLRRHKRFAGAGAGGGENPFPIFLERATHFGAREVDTEFLRPFTASSRELGAPSLIWAHLVGGFEHRPAAVGSKPLVTASTGFRPGGLEP